MNSHILNVARQLVAQGLSVIPIRADGSKAPALSRWKPYQEQLPTETELQDCFLDGSEKGLAIVCGRVSGNLEVLDHDDPETANRWVRQLQQEEGGSEILDKFSLRIRTPSGGYHQPYRCPDGIEGNQKLATRRSESGKEKALIETRGEGGYFLHHVSPAACHELGVQYRLLSGSYSKIPVLTKEERELVWSCARLMTEYVDPNHVETGGSHRNIGHRPGDQFNEEASWQEILEPKEWTKVRSGDPTALWRRPGKDSGWSATTGYAGRDILYVFSSNAAPFERNRGYEKFAAYTLLYHDGDFTRAATDLASRGYGDERWDVEEEWLPRETLPELLPEAPELSEDFLPEAIRPWLLDNQERMQVPLEYVGVPGVVGFASLVGRAVSILPKRRDDWQVIPNQWGALVGRPGVLKSPAMRQALKPVEHLASKARKKYESSVSTRKADMEVISARIDAKKREIKDCIRSDCEDDLEELQATYASLLNEFEELQPTERRYKTNDATVEKIAVLLSDNPRGLMVVRDELSGWIRNLQKTGREGDREFFLEAWNGDSSFTVDRIGRGTLHVDALCLSVFGGIQPGKLDSLVSQANEYGWGDDGLLQRFQLIVYPEIPKDWKRVDRWPDSEARNRVHTLAKRLDRLDPADVGATQLDYSEVPALRFERHAQVYFDQRYEKLEQRLRSGEFDAPAFESHLAKYRSLMPSLALIFHLLDVCDGQGSQKGVSKEAAELAASWCEFLEGHARKVYAGAIRPDLHSAYALARKLKDGSVRDRDRVKAIYHRGWSLLKSRSQVYNALAVLETCNWVRVETVTTGGRPSDVIRLHPDLTGGSL